MDPPYMCPIRQPIVGMSVSDASIQQIGVLVIDVWKLTFTTHSQNIKSFSRDNN